jgi:hypothetical protein
MVVGVVLAAFRQCEWYAAKTKNADERNGRLSHAFDNPVIPVT